MKPRYKLHIEIAALAAALFFAHSPHAAEPAGAAENADSGLWFPIGEELTYRLQWGFIPVGEARIRNDWAEGEDGRRLLAIRVRIRTNSFMDKIYRVDDFLETLVEPASFLPLKYERNVSEGSYRLHEVTTFDHASGKAHWRHLLKDKEETFGIEPDTRDILSFLFFMRSKKLEPHTEYKFKVMADERLHNVEVKTGGCEQFRLPGFNWVESLRIEPTANFEDLFVRANRAVMWVSADERRLCTKIAIEVPVASVTAALASVSGPGDDFWTQPQKYRRLKGGHLVRSKEDDEKED